VAKILIVEDNFASAEIVKTWLTAQRYVVEHARDGAQAMEFLRITDFDVILLDWNLPEVSGFDVLKKIRSAGKTTPVIMVTGKSEALDKEQILDGGADDYLTKPFDLTELSARIRVQLRRQRSSVSSELSVANIVLFPEQLKVTQGGEPVDLLPKEFSLLEFFMRNPDKVFSAEMIMNRVWSLDSESGTNAFRTTLTRLRKKLKLSDDSSLIETVHGAGYRLNSEPKS
jgi:DNA-binding response OmpR family regulator